MKQNSKIIFFTHGKQYVESPENKNLYNSGSELNARLGIYQTPFRQYDSAFLEMFKFEGDGDLRFEKIEIKMEMENGDS